jgi:hypothetical protein
VKLDDWALQYKILEINAALPPKSTWPLLPELLAAVETFPRLSVSRDGTGIFLGWRDSSMQWVYHHGVCVPHPELPHNMYDFHGSWDESAIKKRRVFPAMNIGTLPESERFLQILKGLGIRGAPLGSSLVRPQLLASPDPKGGDRRS